MSKYPILVTGTGRSGTSAVAQILHRLGIFVGDKLISGDATNPYGHWEDADFVSLNQRLLMEQINLANWRLAIRELAKKRKGKKWAVKDPRIADLLSLYQREFPDARYIICSRNRDDVLASMRKSYGNGYPAEDTFDRRQKNIDNYLDNYLEIKFDDLLSDPERTVRRIADYIGYHSDIKNVLEVIVRPQERNLGDLPKVWIAIPTLTGKIHCELMIRMLEWSHDSRLQVKVRPIAYKAPLDNACNVAVNEFLEDGHWDYFLKIDDDVVPPREALWELVRADREVIAPLCFTMKEDDNLQQFPMPVAFRYNKDGKYEPYFPKDNPNGIHETDVVTGGMHLVKKEVFQKIEMPAYHFTYYKNGEVEYSEDFVFSRKCQKAGIKLWTHYGLPCKHLREVDIKQINDLLVKVRGERNA